MDQHFTEADIMLVEKEVQRKSYKDIAFLLDKPVDDVKQFINFWIKEKGIVSKQALMDQASRSRPVSVRAPREKKKKDAVVFSRIIQKPARQKFDRSGRPIFQTKAVDLAAMQSVKIDRKTWIYIQPGQDPVIAKTNFLKVLETSKNVSPAERERETNKRIKESR